MTGFRITIEDNRLKGMDQRLRGRLRQVVERAAQNVQRRAVQTLEAGAAERHGPAAGGGAGPPPPAGLVAEGVARSIRVEMDGDLSARVVVADEYAAVIERGGHGVVAHPFLRPAVEAEAREFERAAAQVLQEELGK